MMIGIVIWILITFSLLIFYSYVKAQRRFGHIPGPQKLPILGNMHQLRRKGPDGQEIPLNLIVAEMAKKYGDVMWIDLGFTNMVILNSYEAMYEALVKKGAEFAGRPSSYRIIISEDDNCIGQMDFIPTHKVLKPIVQYAVRAYGDGPQVMDGIINESLTDLILDLTKMEGNAIPVKDTLRAAFGNTIYILIFGRQIDRTKTTYASLSMLEDYALATWEPSAAGVLMDMLPITRYLCRETYEKTMQYKAMRDDFWNKQIQYHKDGWDGEETRCLLDVLLKEQKNRKNGIADGKCQGAEIEFSDGLISCSMSQLYNAGMITSTTVLTSIVLICLHKPHLQDKLYTDVCSIVGETGRMTVNLLKQMHYTRAFIFEALRYFSINPLGLFKKTTVDTSVAGLAIPKDTTIAMNQWVLHHDADFWTEPWSFMPERFLDEDGVVVAADHPNRKRILPFGAGHRLCVAEHFALNRLGLFLTTLVQQFHIKSESPDCKLPSPDPRTWPFSVTILVPFFKARFIPRA